MNKDRYKKDYQAQKQKQKLEMLQALGHCNEVVGRMLYNAELYFLAITGSNHKPIYNGYQTVINLNPFEKEDLLQIKMRLYSQMQNSLNIIKLFNMNSHKFGEKYQNLNTNESNLILKDIDKWILELKTKISDLLKELNLIKIKNLEPIPDLNIELLEYNNCIEVCSKIKQIITGEYNGSFYDEIGRLREKNKIINKNFQERKTKDMMTYAPYVMESANDTEEDIKNEYNKNENYIPKVRRGQTNSSNKINNYKEEINIMKKIHEYRDTALNEICNHDGKSKQKDCSICSSIIDKNSENMYYQ